MARYDLTDTSNSLQCLRVCQSLACFRLLVSQYTSISESNLSKYLSYLTRVSTEAVSHIIIYYICHAFPECFQVRVGRDDRFSLKQVIIGLVHQDSARSPVL
jgi:hypothetical protein